MQFKNTSDVTVCTDTNEHTTGGELHAKLGGRRTTCQDTVATSVEETGGAGGLAVVCVGGGGHLSLIHI